MLDLVFNSFTNDKKYGAGFFEKMVQKALDELGFKGKNIELSVNLVGEGRIKALNKKYRSKNRVTNVLSFPLGGRVGAKSAGSGIMALGDIFICLPVAKKAAQKEGRVLSSELAFLTVHGLLHLLGYNHEKSKSGAERMAKLQNIILAKLSSL
jgi:probable rRNA maturation factor